MRRSAASICLPAQPRRAFLQMSLDDFPNIRGDLRRIGERPAYRSARRKGDPRMRPMLA
jgi:hypothetical protein